jgi:hypothetical protein
MIRGVNSKLAMGSSRLGLGWRRRGRTRAAPRGQVPVRSDGASMASAASI